jgi:hypothetical protein
VNQANGTPAATAPLDHRPGLLRLGGERHVLGHRRPSAPVPIAGPGLRPIRSNHSSKIDETQRSVPGVKVVVAHNRYQEAVPSGENVIVDTEIAQLTAAGVEVVPFLRSSDSIRDLPPAQKALLPLAPIFGRAAQRDLAALLTEHRPDVVHLHNPYPLLSPEVVRTAHDPRRAGRADGPQLPAGLLVRALLPRRAQLPGLPRQGAGLAGGGAPVLSRLGGAERR